MILTPEILTIFILNSIFLLFGTIAFYLSLKIYLGWDMNSTTKKQYMLQKQSYLSSTFIKYIFIVKLPLFLFFIFTLDKLSGSLVGAMCAAGVVNATSYGVYLFILKILNLYLFGFWLLLHKKDISDETLPYTKKKFGLFTIIYFIFLAEIIVESLMFLNIDPSIMVSCCGTLYSATADSYISVLFKLNPIYLVALFYINFLAIVVAYIFKNRYLYSILSILFLLSSIVSLIVFFGTYIYELPTHHCPFCFLQKDYYYIGYLLYVTLFIGTFYAMVLPFFYKRKYLSISFIFIIIYTAIVSAYPLVYFIINGVWL